jgi:hypothetical protein
MMTAYVTIQPNHSLPATARVHNAAIASSRGLRAISVAIDSE